MENRDAPFYLKCFQCAAELPESVALQRCSECGGVLDIAYAGELQNSTRPRPLRRPEQRLRLGEGSTPLIRLQRIGKRLGLPRLYAKLEFLSPSGSFKDRGSSILLSAALEAGVEAFVEDSSGNAGSSLAAYSAPAGVKMCLFLPQDVAASKLHQAKVLGARVYLVEGPRRAATDAAIQFASREGVPYISHNLSPYFIEGMTSFGYELIDHDGPAIDHVVLPVGNGSLLLGTWLAYAREAAGEGGAPKLHSVQAAAVAPINAAIANNRPLERVEPGETVAAGIAVSMPARGEQVAAAVRRSGGSAASVDENSINEWTLRLAREEGIFCEPTCGAAFAGLEQLVKRGAIEPDGTIVVPITGSGLKDPPRFCV